MGAALTQCAASTGSGGGIAVADRGVVRNVTMAGFAAATWGGALFARDTPIVDGIRVDGASSLGDRGALAIANDVVLTHADVRDAVSALGSGGCVRVVHRARASGLQCASSSALVGGGVAATHDAFVSGASLDGCVSLLEGGGAWLGTDLRRLHWQSRWLRERQRRESRARELGSGLRRRWRIAPRQRHTAQRRVQPRRRRRRRLVARDTTRVVNVSLQLGDATAGHGGCAALFDVARLEDAALARCSALGRGGGVFASDAARLVNVNASSCSAGYHGGGALVQLNVSVSRMVALNNTALLCGSDVRATLSATLASLLVTPDRLNAFTVRTGSDVFVCVPSTGTFEATATLGAFFEAMIGYSAFDYPEGATLTLSASFSDDQRHGTAPLSDSWLTFDEREGRVSGLPWRLEETGATRVYVTGATALGETGRWTMHCPARYTSRGPRCSTCRVPTRTWRRRRRAVSRCCTTTCTRC